jgi:hypothetical protein
MDWVLMTTILPLQRCPENGSSSLEDEGRERGARCTSLAGQDAQAGRRRQGGARPPRNSTSSVHPTTFTSTAKTLISPASLFQTSTVIQRYAQRKELARREMLDPRSENAQVDRHGEGREEQTGQ